MTWTEEQQRRYEEALASYDQPAPPPRRRGPRVNAGPGRVSLMRLDAEGNPTGETTEINFANVEFAEDPARRLEDRTMPRINWGELRLNIESSTRRFSEQLRSIQVSTPALNRFSAQTHNALSAVDMAELRRGDAATPWARLNAVAEDLIEDDDD